MTPLFCEKGVMTMDRRDRFDDDDDFNVGRPRRGDDNPTSAGMIGFIAAMVSLGLLVVVLVLFIFLKSEDNGPAGQHIERTRLLYYWFLILDVLSFFAALTATILGARGSAPTNPLYRGYGVTALILGIIGMAITVLFSLWMMCAIFAVVAGIG
jgi:tetrahydromethanopterin S-methyltransferase subunit F